MSNRIMRRIARISWADYLINYRDQIKDGRNNIKQFNRNYNSKELKEAIDLCSQSIDKIQLVINKLYSEEK